MSETNQEAPAHKDWAGQDIKVGDLIIYAANADRSAVLKAGRVTRLEVRPANEYRWPYKPIPTIRCVTVDAWRENDTWDVGRGLQKEGKEVALSMLDRVVVVNSIPAVCQRFEGIKARAEKAIAEKKAKKK